MTPLITWTLPIQLKSEANIQDHWTQKHKRKKLQSKYLWLSYQNLCKEENPLNRKLPYPCEVKLTRIGKRKLDEDNLIYSFKNIRDCIASYLKPGLAPGQADSDENIKWIYSQCIGNYSIKIEFFPSTVNISH